MKKGDLIEILAPGSAAPFENLEKGAEVLRSWGYQVRYDKNIMAPQLYLAQTDDYRFKNLKRALLDKKVKAIWCLRGGYGAIRLLPELLKLKIPRQKKLLIGFSDVTSLHVVLNEKWKWASLHGSLIDRLATGKIAEPELIELQKCLTESRYEMITSLSPLNAAAKKKRTIRAAVVGGNLVVATSTLGTKSQIKCDGKILFLEETGERGYRVDRCLHQMEQAGVFKKVKAVILGDFINGLESDGRDLVAVTVENFFSNKKIPVFKGMQTGHGQVQRPLFFGTISVLTCGMQPRMLNYSP